MVAAPPREPPAAAGYEDPHAALLGLRPGTVQLPVGSRMLPPWHRKRMSAIFRFAALVRLIVDEGEHSAHERAGLLDALEEDLDRHRPRHPDVRRMHRQVRRHDLPAPALHKLIAAARQDLSTVRYARFEDFMAYAGLSGAPIGELTLAALTRKNLGPTLQEPAESIYTAARALMLCRNVGVDAARGRIYLPQADLHTLEADEDVLLAGVPTHAVQGVLQMEVQRITYQLRADRVILRRLPPFVRIAVSGAYAEADALRHTIERCKYELMAQPVSVSRPERQRAFARALLRR